MDSTVGSNELIKEIRDRIQFLITVQIFFATMTYAFYKSIGSEEALANNNMLFWGIGVAFCLINYLTIGRGEEVAEKALRWIRNSISLNIGLFITPILLFALIVKNPVPGYYKWPFIISFNGSIWMPIATFLLISISLAWAEVVWVRKLFKK